MCAGGDDHFRPLPEPPMEGEKTIICIVMSLQSPEGRLAYIASRANVGCQIRQTQRCARKGYMLIVIGARDGLCDMRNGEIKEATP